MKSRLLFIAAVLFTLKLTAGNDTLRHYDPSTLNTATYNPASSPVEVGRFDLPSSAFIKAFIITVKDTGSVLMSFCGHEGGVALATLFKAYQSFTISNHTMGVNKIEIKLPDSLLLSNDQFFLEFSNFKGKLRLVTDRTNHPVSCTSSSGGDYRYQYGQDATGNLILLSSDNRAFGIDVVLEYKIKTPKNYFKDITTQAGFPTSLSNSSLAVGDYNADNFPDILVSGSLFRNNHDGTFTDVTSALGISNKYSGIAGNAFVDMNNDGWLDIILFGGDTSVLFLNDGISNSFSEHILHLPEFKAFLSFSFADINHDKYPDLFVSQLWQTYPLPEPNYFFYNNKNLDFTDSTKTIYPEFDGSWDWPGRAWDPANYVVERNRNSRGSQWVDFDNDGDLDLFVTNYFLQQDEFYKNNGDGTFTDICVAKNIDRNSGGANHGTGLDWYDYDNDGDMDLLLCQFAHPHFIAQGYDHRGTTIYRNEGAPDYNFKDMVGQYGNYPGLVSDIGLELEETHAGGAWGDIDNDGLADFLMTVFYGCRYIELYHQKPDHTFELVTYDWGLNRINTGTDLVWFDYDCDGKLDLAGGDNGQFRLFKNTFPSRNYIELNLKSTSANKFAIGARVTLFAAGKFFTQEVSAGRGEKMQNPSTLHFGLDWINKIDSVVVLWPSKPQKREVFKGLQTEKTYLLNEGGSVTVGEKITEEPQLSLSIFPVPAKDNLRIELGLPENEKVTIEVFNSLMQKIAVLKNDELKSGNYTFNWSIPNSNASDAVYFINVTTNKSSLIRKIVVLK